MASRHPVVSDLWCLFPDRPGQPHRCTSIAIATPAAAPSGGGYDLQASKLSSNLRRYFAWRSHSSALGPLQSLQQAAGASQDWHGRSELMITVTIVFQCRRGVRFSPRHRCLVGQSGRSCLRASRLECILRRASRDAQELTCPPRALSIDNALTSLRLHASRWTGLRRRLELRLGLPPWLFLPVSWAQSLFRVP